MLPRTENDDATMRVVDLVAGSLLWSPAEGKVALMITRIVRLVGARAPFRGADHPGDRVQAVVLPALA